MLNFKREFPQVMSMMMIAPNSYARQKEGAEGEKGDRAKGGPTGTPTLKTTTRKMARRQ